MNTIKVTSIYNNNGTLAFEGENLATLQDYLLADRCEGSIFEALQPGEVIKLSDGESSGLFELDEELDLIDSNSYWYEWIDREPGNVTDEPGVMRCKLSNIPGAALQRDYFYEVS
jgi:hypothetical protein